jgi:hypothetical protein
LHRPFALHATSWHVVVAVLQLKPHVFPMAHCAPLHAAPVQLVPSMQGPASDEHPEQLDRSYRHAPVHASAPASPPEKPSFPHVAAGVATPSHCSVPSTTPLPHTGQPPSGQAGCAVSAETSVTDVSVTAASTTATTPPDPDEPPPAPGCTVAPPAPGSTVAPLPPSEPPAAGGCEPPAPPPPNDPPPIGEYDPVPAAGVPAAPPSPDLEIAVRSSPAAHARTETLSNTNPNRTIFMVNLGPPIGCPE